MNSSNELTEEAEAWLNDHADSIEFFDKFLPSDCVPAEEEDPEDWISTFGAESDGCVAFRLQPVGNKQSANGIALILGKGNSWEGLQLWVDGIYENEEDALRKVDELGFRI
jgi:hypothetical protein